MVCISVLIFQSGSGDKSSEGREIEYATLGGDGIPTSFDVIDFDNGGEYCEMVEFNTRADTVDKNLKDHVYKNIDTTRWKCVSPLRKHAYSNILKIVQPKKQNFQIKKKSYKNFYIFLLKTQFVGTR